MGQKLASKDRQGFLFLSSIRIASIGIPSLAMGYFLSIQYGPGIAIPSIFVGNLILWLIGISVISVTNKSSLNGIENIRNFIGTGGALFISIIILIGCFDWFSFQMSTTMYSLSQILPSPDIFGKVTTVRIGVALGLFSALLSLGGMKILKWASVITFPCLLFYLIYILYYSSPTISVPISWGLSLSAVLTVILSFLTGVICLPTFFRYSKSLAHSYLALTLVMIFFTLIQCASIFIEFDPISFGIVLSNKSYSGITLIIVSFFILMICVCNNLMNIYFASACYETFSPKFYGIKGHAIMGLLGTATYAFIQVSPSMTFMIDLIGLYTFNLSITLLIAFLIRMIAKCPSEAFEKRINCTAWILGCIVGTISRIKDPSHESFSFLFAAMNATILFFLLFVFLEETTKAIYQLRITGKDP